MFHLLAVLCLVLACLAEPGPGGKVVRRRRRERQVGEVEGRRGSGSKLMPAARAAKAAAASGEGSTPVRGRGGRGGGGRKQKRGGRRGHQQQQGREGRALVGEKSGRGKSRRQGQGGRGRRGGKKIRQSDLPDLKALPGTAFDCDEKNPRWHLFYQTQDHKCIRRLLTLLCCD